MNRIFKNLPFLMLVVFIMLAWQIVICWVFVRFVHYEGQYRSLEPHTYQVEVISPQEFALLSDPSTESVTLSDGSQITDRQPSFYKHVLPNYKKVGDRYILVTTLGTSHYYYRWVTDMMPFAMIVAFGLVLAFVNCRKQMPNAKDSR